VADNRLILAGINGAGADATALLWMAIPGSTAPTDTGTALGAAWKNMGGVTEDGVTIKQSMSNKKIKIYGSTATQRTLITDREYTIDVTFAETNPRVMEVYFQQALNSLTPAVSTGAFSWTVGAQGRQLYAAVIDMVDGSNHLRFYMPQVEVTDMKDLKIANSEQLAYGVTMTAYPTTSGVAIQPFAAIPVLG
jgi:hypothetical protein